MGAATSLLHGDRDPSIAGMVLDSSFSNLKLLAKELAKQYSSVPNFIVSTALSMLRKKIKKKADFDLEKLSPIDHVDKCFIPALFAHANGDDFIDKHHTQDLYNKYAGDKNIIFMEGNHNSLRPQFFLDSVQNFFSTTLQCDQILDQNQSTGKQLQNDSPQYPYNFKNQSQINKPQQPVQQQQKPAQQQYQPPQQQYYPNLDLYQPVIQQSKPAQQQNQPPQQQYYPNLDLYQPVIQQSKPAQQQYQPNQDLYQTAVQQQKPTSQQDLTSQYQDLLNQQKNQPVYQQSKPVQQQLNPSFQQNQYQKEENNLYDIKFPQYQQAQQAQNQNYQNNYSNSYQSNQEDEDLKRAIQESLRTAAQSNLDIETWNQLQREMK